MLETWVQFLGREDPLERKWQPTPVFLPGESHGPGRLQSIGSQESDMTHHYLSFFHGGLIQQTIYLECACVPVNVIAFCPVTIQPITYDGS